MKPANKSFLVDGSLFSWALFRNHVNLIKGSRKKRIAAGSGTDVQHVNKLLKQFEKMQKTMKKMKGGKMKKMMQQMEGMQGQGG